MLSRQPGEQGDVETDPGGIAEGKREWAFGMVHAVRLAQTSGSSDIR